MLLQDYPSNCDALLAPESLQDHPVLAPHLAAVQAATHEARGLAADESYELIEPRIAALFAALNTYAPGQTALARETAGTLLDSVGEVDDPPVGGVDISDFPVHEIQVTDTEVPEVPYPQPVKDVAPEIPHITDPLLAGGDAQLVGKNTCRYKTGNWAHGSHQGDAFYGYSPKLVAGGAARAYASGFPPKTVVSTAQAATGILTAYPSNWPGATVEVTTPWRLWGSYDLNAGGNPSLFTSQAWAEYDLNLILTRVNGVAAGGRVSADGVTATARPDGGEWTDKGKPKRVQTVPRGASKFVNYIQIFMEAGVASDWAVAAQSIVNFTPPYGASMDYQDWKYTLPAGWRISKC